MISEKESCKIVPFVAGKTVGSEPANVATKLAKLQNQEAPELKLNVGKGCPLIEMSRFGAFGRIITTINNVDVVFSACSTSRSFSPSIV
jgi:hypothetical protein